MSAASDDAVHILLLSEREVHVLGAIYGLGVMAALATQLPEEREQQALREAQRLTGLMLDMEPFNTLYKQVRDKILDLATEDAEREGV